MMRRRWVAIRHGIALTSRQLSMIEMILQMDGVVVLRSSARDAGRDYFVRGRDERGEISYVKVYRLTARGMIAKGYLVPVLNRRDVFALRPDLNSAVEHDWDIDGRYPGGKKPKRRSHSDHGENAKA